MSKESISKIYLKQKYQNDRFPLKVDDSRTF